METLLCVMTAVIVVIQRIAGDNPFTSPGLILMDFQTPTDTTVLNTFDIHMERKSYLASYLDRQFSLLSVYPLGQACVVFDKRAKTICKLQYSGGHWYQPVCAETFGTVNGLDVDDVRGLVFWTDPDFNAIMMARITNLTHHHVIVDTLVDNPGDIAVHPEAGLLFWTDFGRLPKVERSTLSGSERRTIVIGGTPYLLTLDRAGNRLFWINKADNTVGSCDTSGERRHPFPINIDGSTSSLAWTSLVVYQSRLLLAWSDINQAGAVSVGLGGESRNNRYLSTTYQDLAIVREQPQLQGMEAECVDCFCRLYSVYENGTLTRQCASEHSSHGYLFFTTPRGLYRMDVYPFTTSYAPHVTLVYGANISVFTTDPVNEKIFAYSHDSKAIIEITQHAVTGYWMSRDLIIVAAPVKSIAVDWMSRNILWVEQGSEYISVANYEGLYRKWLISQAWAEDLRVDPHNRMVFWLNSSLGLVEGADLDGRGHVNIGYTDKQFAALTIDCAGHRLIMFDFRSRELVAIDYLSRAPPEVIRQGFWRVTFMAMIKDYVVVSNDSRCLTLVNTKTGLPLAARYIADDIITHMELYHVDSVMNTSPCVENNGGCDQLCLPNPSTRNCNCGFGYHEVSTDNGCSTYLMDNSFLLVVDQRAPAIYQYNQDRQGHPVDRYTIVPAVGLAQPYAVTYDARAQYIYWSDIEQFSVSRIHSSGQYQEIVYGQEYMYALDITLSVSMRLLFIADYSRNRIIALNVNTLQTTTFSDPVNRVYGLSLDASNRYLYASGYGESPNLVRIDIWTGTQSTENLPWLVLPGKLVVHATGIYLVEQHLRTIVRIDSSGNVHDFKHFPEGHIVQFITADDNNIYWTEQNTQQLYRLNLQTREESTVGLEGTLIHPTGLLSFEVARTYTDISCLSPCFGTCVPAGENRTVCIPTLAPRNIDLPDNDICIVPSHDDIVYGHVKELRPGSRVPGGSQFRVQCLPAHSVVGSDTGICRRRNWMVIPRCEPDTKVYGTRNGGWTIFTRSASFYVYSWMTTVKVIVVGGGGGGYQFSSQGDSAGDGQRSRFGTVTSLISTAGGGKGGTMASGGAGGVGERNSGSAGSFSRNTCSRGGSVWNYVPTKAHSLFCENDYGPGSCFSNHASSNVNSRIRRDCRIDTTCKNFGDGAESIEGGSGGGGGFSRPSRLITAYRNTLIPIEVGRGGDPSYPTAGGGVVIIWWGWDEELNDVETANIERLCSEEPDIEP
ncbi:low-density lipoprotein receptor-related protein 5-like [Mizuhopecten yessoensis]|uniref:Low-density lipoprotein receptor-related protein 5 n=1 Tax=Mizuhopecten yessoensis TaxID=6573 RepID=A0A210R329_MIZYE|nr:low-density lipoprotein receptor-related protein 5-like [Mizuhopecten yessoensis]OWF55409.1 Low-density lipoprotein receptor-related protein 5 [Mizuhopecten yessoensis]